MSLQHGPDIGARLRILRKERHHSLSVLAGKTGMSSATLSRIETGRQDVTMQTFVELCEALGVQPGNFFTGENGASLEDVETALKNVRLARHAFESAAERAKHLEDALSSLCKTLRKFSRRK